MTNNSLLGCQGAKPGKKSGESQDAVHKQSAPDSCKFWA